MKKEQALLNQTLCLEETRKNQFNLSVIIIIMFFNTAKS